jgi:hypothetical protein
MQKHTQKIHTLVAPVQHHAHAVVRAGLWTLGALAFVYVYFVGLTVFDAVGNRATLSSIRKEESAISSLETSYLARIRTLDVADAAALGMHETHSVAYATRDTGAAAVGFAQMR